MRTACPLQMGLHNVAPSNTNATTAYHGGVRTQSCADQADSRTVAARLLVLAGGDAPTLLEARDAAFDDVSALADSLVEHAVAFASPRRPTSWSTRSGMAASPHECR